MSKWIDLRSDTVTQPTEAMREAMRHAPVGDDVYGEDPTMRQLEELAAEMVGKEAALFVPSGTMGNQLALLGHTRRGEEVVLEADAHIHFYEVGGMAALAGVQARQIRGQGGYLPPEEIIRAIRADDLHFPRTSLICLENTHNRSGGTVMTPEQMARIREVSLTYHIPIHLDGARIFNAAVALGCDVREFTRHVDTVMFCLSKGLAAPVGSMLAGDEAFIAKARRLRKMLGGGLRQCGMLAAAGIVALKTMISRLAEDHAHARLLAEGLARMPGITVNMTSVQTNFVVADVADTGYLLPELLNRLAQRGIKVMAFGGTQVRMVTHKDVTRADIVYTLDTFAAVLAEKRRCQQKYAV